MEEEENSTKVNSQFLRRLQERLKIPSEADNIFADLSMKYASSQRVKSQSKKNANTKDDAGSQLTKIGLKKTNGTQESDEEILWQPQTAKKYKKDSIVATEKKDENIKKTSIVEKKLSESKKKVVKIAEKKADKKEMNKQ